MKKTIYILLTALALNLLNCYGAFGGTLNNNIGVTNFLFDSNNNDKLSNFKLQRYFVDNFRVTKDSTLEFWTQPTMQNFKHDDVLAAAKNIGVKNIWCFQGKMPHHVVQGKANKVNPIRDSDSPQNPRAWDDFCFLVKQVAIRYADDSQAYLSQAHVHASADYQNNIPKAGLGLLYGMEYTNEPDFLMSWSGAIRTFEPEDFAVGFKGFRDSTRVVSKSMRIIMSGTIQPKVETFNRFITKLKQLYAAEGKEMPTDWYLNFHWYMRNGSNNQGAGTWGVSPETANAYKFGLQLDSICRQYSLLGWYCTETGWSTYTTGTNVSLAKQNAPVMQGYDIYHSQGLCMVRLGLIWGATEYCQGITFWNRKDNDDVGAYQNGGVNYSNWSPKYCQTIIAEYQSQYRYHDIKNCRTNGTLYAVDLIASADTTTLVWTDLNRYGEYDAKPKEGQLTTTPPPTEPPQTTGTLKVSLSANPFPNSVPLNGFKAESGAKLYIWWDGTGKTPFTFQPSGQRESGAPYEYKGGQSVVFPDGTHTVTITDGNNVVIGTATFIVGTIIEPPAKESVIEIWYEDGKIYYKTEKRVVSNYAE